MLGPWEVGSINLSGIHSSNIKFDEAEAKINERKVAIARWREAAMHKRFAYYGTVNRSETTSGPREAKLHEQGEVVEKARRRPQFVTIRELERKGLALREKEESCSGNDDDGMECT